MPTFGKLLVTFVLAAMSLPPRQAPGAQAGPPPVEAGLEQVRADAAFDVAAVTSISPAPDSMWIVSATQASALRIDVKSDSAGDPVPLDDAPCGAAAFGLSALWIPLCGDASLARIDRASGAVRMTPLPGLTAGAGAVTTGVGSVWVLADGKGTLLRVDPDSGLPVADVYLPAGTSALAYGMDALWASSTATGQVIRVNPHTNVIDERVPVGKAPTALAIGEGAVWVVSGADGTVARIDPKTNRVSATIAVSVSGDTAAIAAGEGAVWVSSAGTPLVRIDARSNRVTHRIVGEGGGAIAVAHRSLWIGASGSAVWRVDPRLVAALR